MSENLSMIEIIEISTWKMNLTDKNMGNPTGEVKHYRYQKDIDFYTRENIYVADANPVKTSRTGSRQVSTVADVQRIVELLAPSACWFDIARLVRYEDPYQRPVRRNPDFNEAFIATLTFVPPEK
jgi:hypothetical protein